MSSYISLPTFAASIDQRLRLAGSKCTECGTVAFPKRKHCLNCNAISFEDMALRDTGEVYSFTVIAAGGAPAEFDQQQTLTGVITVAVVALDDGPHVIGQVVDTQDAPLTIGTRLTATPRRLYDQEGVIRYGLKFRPVAADE